MEEEGDYKDFSDSEESEAINDQWEGQESESEKEDVLPINESEDSSEDEPFEDDASEASGSDEGSDFPNEEAWGRKKSVYYSADFVDEDRGRSYREEDREAAKAEEADALAIQRKYLQSIHSSVFKTSSFVAKEPVGNENEVAPPEWKTISAEEKVQIVSKKCPELISVLLDFKKELTAVCDLISVWRRKGQKDGVLEYLSSKYQLYLHYFMNLSFFVYLKASNIEVSHRQVMEKIKKFKHLLGLLKNLDSEIEKKSKKRKEQTAQQNIGDNGLSAMATKKNRQLNKEETEVNGRSVSEAEVNATDEPEDEAGKRIITYQIAKNKGLTAYKKKEYRNPRVRHRMKFRKAEIRRKGQVKKPRTEVQRYGGEISGIHANVTRSIKLK